MSDEATPTDHDLGDEPTGHPLDGLYDANGLAGAESLPPNRPVLSGGSRDEEAVPALVAFLNRELGTALESGDCVTQPVLLAVQQARQQLGIADEQGLYPAENFVGPQFWAAVHAYDLAA